MEQPTTNGENTTAITASTQSQSPALSPTQALSPTPAQPPSDGSPAACDEARQTIPPCGPETSSATSLNPGPATDEESWRRNRPPRSAPRPSELKPSREPAPLPTALRVEFRFKAMGGSETITEFASSLDLPLGLEPSCLAHTDTSFGELLRRSVIEPLEIKVRQYLQRRFEEANSLQPEPAGPSSGPIDRGDKRDLSASLQQFLAEEAKRATSAPPTACDGFPEVLPEIPGRKHNGSGLAGLNGSAKNG